MSECNEALIYAYDKGYRITDDGKLISPKGNEITGKKNDFGYVFMNIRMGGKYCRIAIHRLAAYQKYGDSLFYADCVRHLNGNPNDFSLSNIAIGSFSQNMMDIPKEVRIYKAKRAASFVTKFSDEDVVRIKDFHRESGSYKKTMEKFGIKSKGTLHFIIHNR